MYIYIYPYINIFLIHTSNSTSYTDACIYIFFFPYTWNMVVALYQTELDFETLHPGAQEH